MLQYILSWIIFFTVEKIISFDVMKGTILKNIIKLNRASKIFALPLAQSLSQMPGINYEETYSLVIDATTPRFW